MSSADSVGLDAAAITACFNNLFSSSHEVLMTGGAPEPDYRPGDGRGPARIRFRSDFPHSALHEAAHWCLAGAQRRRLPDYGYWYQPPPRDPQAQDAFARVESRVQGLEAIFTEAAGLPFRVSVDDVDNLLEFEAVFARQVASARRHWLAVGLPARAQRFRQALADVVSGCG